MRAVKWKRETKSVPAPGSGAVRPLVIKERVGHVVMILSSKRIHGVTKRIGRRAERVNGAGDPS